MEKDIEEFDLGGDSHLEGNCNEPSNERNEEGDWKEVTEEVLQGLFCNSMSFKEAVHAWLAIKIATQAHLSGP